MSDYRSTPMSNLSAISWEEQVTFRRDDNDIMFSWIFKVLARCVHSKEAANINFIFISLPRPGLEPTIYTTKGGHANHYTTDAVKTNYEQTKINFQLFHGNNSFLSSRYI